MQSRLYIDGEEWVPSKHMAKQAGLVADYVSRLCRQGEVRGRKINGVWYVSVTSFTSFQEEALERKAEQRAALAQIRKEEYTNNVVHTDGDPLRPLRVPQGKNAQGRLLRPLLQSKRWFAIPAAIVALLVLVGVGSYGVQAFRTTIPTPFTNSALTQPANIF